MKNIHKIGNELFITSDEEIKEGDWFYVKTLNIYSGNVIAKCLGFGQDWWSEHILTDTTDERGYHPSHCVKIILTTDQDLIEDGVQAIDDEFLEWFVKNPTCESVEVKNISIKVVKGYNNNGEIDCYYTNGYEIIIPQEEPKQLTDLEFAVKLEKIKREGRELERLKDIELEEVFGSSHCQFSVIENNLAKLYRNQEKILKAIKLLRNDD